MKIFRARSPKRDKDNDERRCNQLVSEMERIVAEIVAEKEGLARRYLEYQAQAQGLIAALEAEGGSSKLDNKLDAYEQAMMYCETRQSTLSRMLGVVRDTSARFQHEIASLDALAPARAVASVADSHHRAEEG